MFLKPFLFIVDGLVIALNENLRANSNLHRWLFHYQFGAKK